MWNGARASGLGKDAALRSTSVQGIECSDLAVAEAVSRVCKLYRDERSIFICIELRPVREKVVHEGFSNGQGEELMNYDPLVVPPHQAQRLFQNIRRWHAQDSEECNEPPSKIHESQGKLRDD